MSEIRAKASIISDQIDPDLETACRILSEKGWQWVELHNVFGKSIEQCSEKEVEEIRRILSRYQLRVSNIASTIFFLCPLYPEDRVSLFKEDFYAVRGDVNTHLSYLERACQIAKRLNCPHVRVFPFRYPDNKKEVLAGTDAEMEMIAYYLKQAAEIAGRYDIVLALENCPYSRCPKGEMTGRLVSMVDSRHLKLLWDPANSYRAEKKQVPSKYLTLSLPQEGELIKEQIAHVHLKNYHYDAREKKPFLHRALLEGDIAYPALQDVLKKQGCLSLEPEVEREEALRSMDQLEKLVKDMS